ncbi:hypothetical protein [Kamptonema sp. UHCC 0994]|uniref:hypothetical protein n=1 Tax=Kamptonema sp. UHCC 0994 TaxID=3031329 RepID=UPI0023B938CC|nr:hypothetical protein [Kamptonema sp. UHCC 0994]MDF0554924.1 hypothetical protein [Kamptonema sp. UHCC 0994]
MPRNTTARRAPRCTKGFPCGSSCQAQGRRCNRPLPGQFSNHADWIAAGNAVHGGGGSSGGSGVATAGGSSGRSGATQSPQKEVVIQSATPLPSPAIASTSTPSPVSASQVTTAETPARRRGRPPLTEAERQKKEILAKAARVGWSEEDIRKVQGVRKEIPHREISTNSGELGKTTAAELMSIGVKPPRNGDSVELSFEERARLRKLRELRGGLGEREFLSRNPRSEDRDIEQQVYRGERVQMYISPRGTVSFTVDGNYIAYRDVGENMPAEEAKMMIKCWKHYLSQPRSKRSMDCVPATGDGRDRESWYKRYGFKESGFQMELHNQFDLPD